MLETRDFLQSWMAAHPLLCLLGEPQRERLAGQARCRTFAPGEIIFWQDDPGEGMWVVESGSVKVQRLGPDGDSQTLWLLGPGDSFDEIAALDGGVNPDTAAALDEVSAWLIPGESLAALVRQDARFAEGVVRFLTGRVRAQQVEYLTMCAVDARLDRCPVGALALVEGKAVLVIPQACTYCTECETVCPSGAIELPFLVCFDDHGPSPRP